MKQDDFVYEELWYEDGTILDNKNIFYNDKRKPDRYIDAKGLYVIPGLIDVQINGCFGHDFTSDYMDIESCINKVSYKLLTLGVTSFCPTIVSTYSNVYKHIVERVKRTKGTVKNAEVLGLHFEGPFINNQKRGAHDVNALKDNIVSYQDILDVYHDLSQVSIVTIAPELMKDDGSVIKKLSQNVKVVSIGHSTASTYIGEKAVINGASMITHLFNAMQQFHHRDPGLIGLVASSDIPHTPYYGIICDGIHTNKNSLKMAYKTNKEKAVIVTDAMAAMGLPTGEYKLGNMEVSVIKNNNNNIHSISNEAYIKNTDTLAGSTITMLESIRNFQQFTNCSLHEAVQKATITPAMALNIQNRKGQLIPNCDADFLIVNKNLDLKKVFVAGEEFNLD